MANVKHLVNQLAKLLALLQTKNARNNQRKLKIIVNGVDAVASALLLFWSLFMIHAFINNDLPIVLDVNSGAVHGLDMLAYDVVMLMDKMYSEEQAFQASCPEDFFGKLSKKYSKNDIAEVYEELYYLYKNGQLFSADDYDFEMHRDILSPIKAMCLHV